jgi:hypothetical protein
VSDELMDPAELYRLRRSVYVFLSRYARFLWAADGEGLHVPPALAPLPAHQRSAALAPDEAQRLAESHLYLLDAEATDLAVRLGAAIRTSGHPTAVYAAGHPNVVASMGITPPAPCGFLRWASGVGYQPEGGAPIIACHWGTVPEGTWLAWWADNHITAQSCPAHLRQQYLAFAGPLCYEQTMLLGPARDPCAPSPGAVDSRAAETGDDTARVYTLLGAWVLLAVPGLAALTRHEPSSAEITADRRAGIAPSPVTYCTGRGSPELTTVIDVLNCDAADR